MGGGTGGQVIPLCFNHHEEAHRIGPIEFFRRYGIVTCSDQRWKLILARFGQGEIYG